MKRSEYIKIFLLRVIGNFLLLSAIVGVVLTFAPAAQAEFAYRYNQFVGQKFYVSGDVAPSTCAGNVSKPGCRPQDKKSGFGLLLEEPPPLAISPLDPNFDIVIPKIGANAKVLANVNPGKESEYLEALKRGVAHADGTAYPGQTGNSFLFAHSVGNFWEVSRWNAVFYLLRELNPGDEVDVFYNGVRYLYRVYDKKVVDPADTQYLNIQTNFPMLTLQTCWPPGTTLKRLLVFARLQNR